MSLLLGMAMLGALTFLPLYQQTVQHASPTGSGLMLIPLMLGSTVTSLDRRPGDEQDRPVQDLADHGAVIMTIGLYLLTHLGANTSRLTSALYFVVLGVGMGFLMQITSLIAQNSVPQRDMGVASSSRSFFQQIGGSLGVSLFGVIFFRRFSDSMSSLLHTHRSVGGSANLDPATINSMPLAVKNAAFHAISSAISGVFWWTIPTTVAVFLLALLVKEIPLRGRIEPTQEQVPAEPELVHGV